MNLEGQVALVTAAGRGIGRGIAESLAEAGAIGCAIGQYFCKRGRLLRYRLPNFERQNRSPGSRRGW